MHENMQQQTYPEPLELSGCLDKFESILGTPCIGTEFPNVNLVDWLRAPNSDELIRDLGITIAQRGVVFFRAQTELTNELHKELITRLGQLTGRPKENGLHKHPLDEIFESPDPEIISMETVALLVAKNAATSTKKLSAKNNWHTDYPAEQHPADFSSLRLTDFPSTGGDTIFASSYEVYDRFSKPFQRLLESLTVTYAQKDFQSIAEARGMTIYQGPRGSPANVGAEIVATHPVVRTNPVTGWKSTFVTGPRHVRIDDVSDDESDMIINKIGQIVMESPDLQVRMRWKNSGDIALWDNRAVYHAPIVDCEGPRRGWRVVGMGGQPYLDPNSMSRAEATAQKKKLANGSSENGTAEAMAEKKKLANGSCGCDGMAEAMATKKKLANGSAKNGV